MPELKAETTSNHDLAVFPAEDLLKIANMPMPFGRYKGRILVDLPEPYVVWFYNQGLPKGELGRLLGLLYEVRLNGLEALFDPLRRS